MDKIELDCTKLLGFKIIADDGSTVRLSSPKIGDKDCPSFNQDSAQAVHPGVGAGRALAAKVGVKSD
jgi:hypothetical protein